MDHPAARQRDDPYPTSPGEHLFDFRQHRAN
jgi:hypothetical protein